VGIILDSNVFIAAERRNWSAQYLLSHLEQTLPLEKFEIPATVAAELIHGIFRSKTAEQIEKRTAFIE
jgi:predicted nucleic acid-binding protein